MKSGIVREAEELIRNYRCILSYTGIILALCGLLMLTPLTVLLIRPEERVYAFGFLAPALTLVLGGILLWKTLRPQSSDALTVQEGGVIVLLSWCLVFLFSAYPFMYSLDIDFTNALFESVSGWTTTGLSVVDITNAGHAILLWRSIMQFAGGAGLAIIMLSAITGPPGPGLSTAEGRGELLVPSVRRSAKLVTTIYVGYAVVGIAALRLSGMSTFDAVNHGFAALSTGGFSTRPQSIGFWDSPAIEAVTIPLMLLGSLSFSTAWLLLRGRFRPVFKNGELHLLAFLLPAAIASVWLLTCRGLYPSLAKDLRVAVFETVAALTSTGFTTVDYENWNGFGLLLLVGLMLVGGGTCSTAGGIKQYRIHTLVMSLIWEIRKAFVPRNAVAAQSIWQGEERIYLSDLRVRQVGVFVFLYLMTWFLGGMILAAHGYGFKESLFEFASAVGTVGLSLGVTSAQAPVGVLWAEIIGMFLGRLEFLVILVGFAKIGSDVWKISAGYLCRSKEMRAQHGGTNLGEP